MRCFVSLVLGLLALEVALARNLQEQAFNPGHTMCPEASSSEDTECINCQNNEECAQNAMCCCPSSCGNAPKAGSCPWNPPQLINAGPCPKEELCFRDSDCPGNMKCCNVNCVMSCVNPGPEISFQ